jgi:putative membrane protein
VKFDPRRVLLTLSTAGLVAISGPAAGIAQAAPISTTGAAIELRQGGSDSDLAAVDDETAFIRMAISDAASEIDAAKLAMDRAGDPVVRKFAEQLIRENQKIMDDATDVADKADIGAPQRAMNDDEHALLNDLQDSRGVAFDETYLRAFVQDQRVTLQHYLEARDKLEGDVAKFADRHVGELSDQLRASVELARRLNIEIEED